MISLSDSERDEMGGNGKNAVLNYFVYDKLAKDFERLFTYIKNKHLGGHCESMSYDKCA